MRIVVAGGSGLLGSALIARLVASGHAVNLLTRDPERARRRLGAAVTTVQWDGASAGPWEKTIDGADAVVNLAGESIASKRWTGGHKKIMVDSRVGATRALVQSIIGATNKPAVLVNASAVGYYGNVPEAELDETAHPGKDFLASLCVRWEEEAFRAELAGVRVVTIRSGLVLTSKGGALAPLHVLFNLCAGGPLGSGRQWWPWVHIDDEIGIIIHALTHTTVSGPVNAVSPAPVRMKEFARSLARVLHRIALIPAPRFGLRLVLGEMADALLLSSQRAVPKKILQAEYVFAYTDLDTALRSLLA